MIKYKFLMILFLSVLFFNCKNETKVAVNNLDTIVTKAPTVADTPHNASNALDWEGTYKGIVPCADCEGIQTTITLNKNLTYVLTTVYLGKKNHAESELNGKFFWNTDGLKIVLEGIENAPNQYFVGENNLFQLDMKGNRITGNLAKNYQLQKVNQL